MQVFIAQNSASVACDDEPTPSIAGGVGAEEVGVAEVVAGADGAGVVTVTVTVRIRGALARQTPAFRCVPDPQRTDGAPGPATAAGGGAGEVTVVVLAAGDTAAMTMSTKIAAAIGRTIRPVRPRLPHHAFIGIAGPGRASLCRLPGPTIGRR